MIHYFLKIHTISKSLDIIGDKLTMKIVKFFVIKYIRFEFNLVCSLDSERREESIDL